MADKKALAGPARTADYKPAPMTPWGLMVRNLPPFTGWHIPYMLIDPTIRLGLAMRLGPLCSAEFAYKDGEQWVPGVRADNAIVGEFVLQQMRRLWKYDLEKILADQIWGWSGGEVVYKLDRNKQRVEFDTILDRKSADIRALVKHGEVRGIRVRRVKGVPHVDLFFPKAFFSSFTPEPGTPYGRSILQGAYSPWWSKWMDGGALDVRELFMHKDAYGGQSIYYPPGTTSVDGVSDPVPNRDIALQIVENAKSGHVLTLPAVYDQSGKELWKYEHAKVSTNPTHILEYPKNLDVEILRGLEVPDDVLTSESTGAWAGKAVPQHAFYTGLERWLASVLKAVVTQIMEPLVLLNFGKAEEFEVCTKPLHLAADEADKPDQPGEQGGGAGGDSWEPYQGNRGGSGYRNRATGSIRYGDSPQAMSLERQMAQGVVNAERIVSAVKSGLAERYQRLAVAHAPKGGVSIDGVDYVGGQFIPGKSQEEVDRAAKEQGGGEEPSVSDVPKFGTVLSPEQASELVAKLRGGDARSKNEGRVGTETIREPLVVSSVPLSEFSDEYIEFLDETTNSDRVDRYVGEKIGTPVFAKQRRKGGGMFVSDGGHRVMAAIKRGDKEIPALVPVDVHERLHGGKQSDSSANPKVLAWAQKRFKDPEHAKNFAEWFGDSKVVDENGEPLVVYHGTATPQFRRRTSTLSDADRAELNSIYHDDEKVEDFWKRKEAESDVREEGFDTFKRDKIGSATDDGYAGRGFYFTSDPSVAESYGSVIMPAFLNIRNPFDMNGKNFKAVLDSHGGAEGFSNWLRDNGYDGAVLWSQFMTLDPQQIKSATGNRGTFDPADDRINMSGMVRMDTSGKWVTIGAKDHKGGTPVKLDDSGRITKGPKHLTGHDVDRIPKRKDLFGDAVHDRKDKQGGLGFEDDDGYSPSADERQKWGENVEFKPDGRVVGTALLKADDIIADPERFQFKVSGIGDEGVTEELKEVSRFRPEFAGQLLVWKDPADGKTYVVNGHHRHELANRTDYKGKIPVFAVDAKDAKEARALGALANIAEGRGTSVDAAKFMRDMGVGVDDIREHGISLKGKVAEQGATLAKLSDGLFKQLVNEDIREQRALAIAKELGDKPDLQDKLARIVSKRDAKGRDLPDSTVAEMAREMASTPTVKETKGDLFGSWEEEDSVFVERNELKAWIKSQLSEEKRTFKSVSKSGRDSRLQEAGNVLDSEKNRQLADAAGEDFYVFDKLSNSRGEISDAVNAAAVRLRKEPKQKRAIQRELLEQVRQAIREADA